MCHDEDLNAVLVVALLQLLLHQCSVGWRNLLILRINSIYCCEVVNVNNVTKHRMVQDSLDNIGEA